MVLLNSTPASESYAVSYSNDVDRAARIPEAKSASTIVYRQDEKTKKWEGLVLAFEWAVISCLKTNSGVIDKLCADLWYLKRVGKPEDFVKVVKAFELPNGISPKDWARHNMDPLKMLGLAK